jgi:hypothetical protein
MPGKVTMKVAQVGDAVSSSARPKTDTSSAQEALARYTLLRQKVIDRTKPDSEVPAELKKMSVLEEATWSIFCNLQECVEGTPDFLAAVALCEGRDDRFGMAEFLARKQVQRVADERMQARFSGSRAEHDGLVGGRIEAGYAWTGTKDLAAKALKATTALGEAKPGGK